MQDYSLIPTSLAELDAAAADTLAASAPASALADYLPIAGGTMLGHLDLNSQNLLNVGELTASGPIGIGASASATRLSVTADGTITPSTSDLLVLRDASANTFLAAGTAVNTVGGRGFLSVNNPTSDSNGSGFVFGAGGRSATYQFDGSGNTVFRNTNASTGTYFDFNSSNGFVRFRAGSGGTTVLSATAAGRVGVGTPSPSETFTIADIAGGSAAARIEGGTGSAAVRLLSASGQQSLIQFYTGTSTLAGAFLYRHNASNRMEFITYTGGDIWFAPGGNAVISSGSVGVGAGATTPTAKVDIDGDTVRLRTSRTPASMTAAGNAGDICWDSNYRYQCVATNTWRFQSLHSESFGDGSDGDLDVTTSADLAANKQYRNVIVRAGATLKLGSDYSPMVTLRVSGTLTVESGGTVRTGWNGIGTNYRTAGVRKTTAGAGNAPTNITGVNGAVGLTFGGGGGSGGGDGSNAGGAGWSYQYRSQGGAPVTRGETIVLAGTTGAGATGLNGNYAPTTTCDLAIPYVGGWQGLPGGGGALSATGGTNYGGAGGCRSFADGFGAGNGAVCARAIVNNGMICADG